MADVKPVTSPALGARGAVAAVVDRDRDETGVGAFLDSVGESLISCAGAAIGPLYGTALVKAGKVATRLALAKEA
jgi:dihydroxyacetone kinase